ncbi:transporter substrate-binding domain-containing protein [Pseudoalteromonas sp. SR44-8]|uniref:substrate-binding periplasmic protein n=1 Tax=Pseudoalteromonas sp. SR44-8 TaxID=2760933 RepID=UPI001600E9BE|nr:transporter substrate-binding domain-containing protein [Pseudoalteromonas sp. SR44-8]MBB1300254.1 transporter substrate-binding domain-containing protein [Pseudoalteromonas sp. SR44-8]
MILRMILLLSLLSNININANAQDPEPELTILLNDWPPYNFNKGGKLVGISTELVEAALQKANIKYKLLVYPFKRALYTVQETPNTLLFTVARIPELENMYKWIGPLHTREVYLYKLNSRSDIQINKIADIKQYKTSVLMGGSVEQFLKRNHFQENIDYYVTVNSEQILKALFKKRTDLIPGDPLDLAYQMKTLGYDQSAIEKAYLLSNEGGYYMIANKKTSDEMITKIQKSLDEVLASDKKDKTIEKYLQIKSGSFN